MSIDNLRAALKNSYVQAFLYVVAAGESHETDPEAYQALYGWEPGNGKTFTGWGDHPRIAVKSSFGWTSAAGRYQAMCAVPPNVRTDTWGDYKKWCAQYEFFPDFSPAGQDLFAAWCLQRRGALPLLYSGKFVEAVRACNREWASLPESPYGQGGMSWDKATAVWDKWVKKLAAAGTVSSVPQPTVEQTKESTVAPALLGLLGPIANAVIDMFTPLGKEKFRKEAERSGGDPAVVDRLTNTVIDALKAATKQEDVVQALVEVQKHPETVVPQVERSVLDELAKMAPILDKLAQWDKEAWTAEEESRNAAAGRAREETYDMTPLLLRGAFAVVGALIAMVGGIVVTQVVKNDSPDTATWSALTGLIGWATGTVTTIYAYRFGTTRNSSAKDVVIGELSRRKTPS